MNSYIEFKKERDLGAIVNDTFRFLRENWKSYGLFVLKIVGPIILVGAAIVVFIYLSYITALGNGNDPSAFLINFDNIVLYLFGMFFSVGIVYTLIAEVSLYYIKSYIDNGGVASFDEVRSNTIRNLMKFVGFGIVAILMVVVGYFMCFLPAIYLVIVLTLGFPILVFEKREVMDTISHCFNLIKNEWWNTFGVFFVFGILVTVLGMIFNLPMWIYNMISEGIFLQSEPSGTLDFLKDPIYIGLTVISFFGKFIFYSISFIASAFVYFDLNEQKYRTGMHERIDNLGNY